MQHRTYAYRIPWTKWSGLVIVASGEVLACFRLRGGLSGKLRLVDSTRAERARTAIPHSHPTQSSMMAPGWLVDSTHAERARTAIPHMTLNGSLMARLMAR